MKHKLKFMIINTFNSAKFKTARQENGLLLLKSSKGRKRGCKTILKVFSLFINIYIGLYAFNYIVTQA